MKIVVDASVAVKWVVVEPDTSLALELFDQGDDLCAPDLLLVEVGNVLWKKVRRKEISDRQADEGLEKIEAYFDQFVSTRPLLPRALRIANEIDHPIYDCIYLAFAEKIDAPLITGDRRRLGKASPLSSIRIQVLTAGDSTPH